MYRTCYDFRGTMGGTDRSFVRSFVVHAAHETMARAR